MPLENNIRPAPKAQANTRLSTKFNYVDIASRAIGADPWLIRSKSRYRSLVRARWAMAHVMRDSFGRSYAEIGFALRRNHSTIMYGIEKSRQLVETDDRHAELVDIMRECA